MASLWQTPAGRLATELTQSDFEEFARLCSQKTEAAEFPLAKEIAKGVPVFSSPELAAKANESPEGKKAVMDELYKSLTFGPGVLVIRDLLSTDIIDRTEAATKEIKAAARGSKATSLRTPFFNLQHAAADPESYAEYYSSETLALMCEAWLGPGYQITTSTNGTFRGGEQQAIHRDYHMSHQPLDKIQRFPLITQVTNQLLTLQAAIAHTDMPYSTGPTCFMPYSHQYQKGYLAFKRPEYIDFVKPKLVQLELKRGDAVFFNPATFHQPGINVSEGERSANLFQVNSAFSRPMETLDRCLMAKAVWPVFKRWHKEVADGQRRELQFEALISATCDDYGYPRNNTKYKGDFYDTQAVLIKQALKEGWSDEKVFEALDDYDVAHKF